ncbi:MAG: acetyl-CoA carboxylase carboxyl transferase subunit beta, partial [Candidatus Saganbacteria bacterium]|nr:acetyl-CoA carboxylase carboxyl transferase subunit beta [Candidatus Saganbacteria bacterium]
MSINDWFKHKKKKETSYTRERLDIPGNLWVKCYKCNQAIFARDLEENLKVCQKCGYHFKLTAGERLKQLVDNKSFKEINPHIKSINFLNFTDSKSYTKRIAAAILKSSLSDAIVTGTGKIDGSPAALGIMDFSFMGGSMGSVVGEK